MKTGFKRVLRLEQARAMVDVACDAASREGLTMSIAVVDDGGYPLSLARMDGAGLLTAKVAMEKARTAALLRAASRMLAERIADEPALLRLTEYLPMAGGLPVKLDNQCIGAIGVSGGSADQDERIAAAGIRAMEGNG